MIPEHAVSARVQVPFHDCDPLGVVWHGRYFEYLEVARTDLFRSFHLDMQDLRELRVKVFVSDVRCRYTSPLNYGDTARVTAWVSGINAQLEIAYDVFNETTGRRSARAHMKLALTDHTGRLLWSVPEPLLACLPDVP